MGVDPRRLENADLCVNTEFGRGFTASELRMRKKPAAQPASERRRAGRYVSGGTGPPCAADHGPDHGRAVTVRVNGFAGGGL